MERKFKVLKLERDTHPRRFEDLQASQTERRSSDVRDHHDVIRFQRIRGHFTFVQQCHTYVSPFFLIRCRDVRLSLCGNQLPRTNFKIST